MFKLNYPAISHLCFTRTLLLFRFRRCSSSHLYNVTHVCCFNTAAKHIVPTRIQTFSHLFQDCSRQKAINPGKQAHGRMIVTGFQPTVFVTNCLIQLYVKCCNLKYAYKVFDGMSERDVISWNAMVFGYATVGDMVEAQLMFDAMPERDVVSWNSLVSGYLQNGSFGKAVDVFLEMRKGGVVIDPTTFAVVLKACLGLENYFLGVQIHGVVVRMGFDCDVVTGSALLDMYAKCKKLKESIHVFNEMPKKNWVSWSALIAGCVQNREFFMGLNMFKEMQIEGIGVSQSIYASVFRSCADVSSLSFGSQMHGHTIKANFGSDIIVGTATLDMYSKCGRLSDARKLFDRLPNHNLQSYNAIIVGYARASQGSEALQIFRRLVKSGLRYDEISLSAAFSACAAIKGYLEGMQLHALAIKSTLWSNVCVANAMLDMYGKVGALTQSFCVFDEMERRDPVSWNAIIAAYEQNGDEGTTLSFLVSMLRSNMEPDEFTYGSVLKACASRQTLNYGMEIHGRITKSGMGLDSFVGSALVDMYCKCEKVEEAEKLHNRMAEKTIMAWNAIISGFSLVEQSEEAQNFFAHLLEVGVTPDNFTYATVLDTCANLATIQLGRQIHAQVIKQEMQVDVFICSTLVDMYAKCGYMQDSRLMFEKASKRDFVTWNAMISGYAQHGLAEEALQIFEAMQLKNVKPNHATFVAVLRACAHIGLVKRGLKYFYSMSSDYKLDPQLEHYSCMIDILGRSGQVNDALKLINEMPFEADDVIWRTLLSICKLQGNVEMAEKAASSLLKLDPQDSSAYILLSNIYADAGMWDEVSKMRKIMRYTGLKKEPGCSWIELQSELHMFLIGDKAHPKCKEIYEKLDILTDDMTLLGYEPGVISLIQDADTT